MTELHRGSTLTTTQIESFNDSWLDTDIGSVEEVSLLEADPGKSMAYLQGRLINHVHLRVSDLDRSRIFYRAVLESIGLGKAFEETEHCFYADELYVDQADNYVSRVHLAFQAPTHDAVVQFHKAALAAGGTDNGEPGPRSYHSHYFAAFVLDPDGNNIEVVCEEPTRRSSDAVVVTRLPKV